MIKSIRNAIVSILSIGLLVCAANAQTGPGHRGPGPHGPKWTNAPVATAAAPAAPVVAPLWNFELAGSGSTVVDGDGGTALGLTLGLSKDIELILPAELGFRQMIGWDVDGSDFTGRTEAFIDWQLYKYKKLSLFVGPNLSYNYGSDIDASVSIGPEFMTKYFVKDDIFLFGRVNYDYTFVSNGDSSTRGWGDNIRYSIGLGFKF